MSQANAPFSFPDAEQTTLKFWKENDIFKKSLAKTATDPVYTFYDGPPFATGLPHHGHLLASTIKDIIPRYFTMNGRYVSRRFGWDCHGLPVEYEIDKKLGKPTHEVVEEQGISGYNAHCRSIVQRYAEQWQSTITRIGRWVDFDNDYKTMNAPFMESVWWVFKQLWDKDLIYRGTKIVPYSTALSTGLSNFEAGSNYQDVQDPAVVVLVKLSDEDAHLAIWTTTPWTLPSNLGICVNANTEYVKVRDEDLGVVFYVAKARLEAITKKRNITELDHLTGAALAQQRYEPLFPYFNDLAAKGAFQVHCDDFVTTEDGTGLVHMAPGFGEDDHRVMATAGIDAMICPIDDQGCFTDEVSDYCGVYVKDADKAIMKDLKSRGLLYDQATLVHSYPFCPRSDTPLIYRAIPSWYVNVESFKDRLIANNDKINWTPQHIQHGRFGKWLAGARDWAISRNRVWGTPLPLWINDTTHAIHCVGSITELETLTGTTVTDLHRDHVDDLTFSKDGEPGVYRRITEVLDCWFESGSMPYAQQHYPFENQTHFEQGFPAEFIAEGLDQTRGWFYTLTVLATALFDQPAFKNVIVSGIVMAEDGKKMSKRLKNYTAPDELMDTYGADALRLYLINSGLVKAEEQRFADQGVKDMVRRTLLPWLNSFKFLQTYASIDGWRADQHFAEPEHVLDRWILSRLQSLLALIERHMQDYKLYLVVPELLLFIDDLTNIYIRLNRARFWNEGLAADKCQAYSTLFTVITTFSTSMAPFTPFLAETIYRDLLHFYQHPESQPESVHLCDYPKANTAIIDRELEAGVTRLQHILLLGRQKRNDLKIKIKTPLATLTVIHKDQHMLDEIKKLAPIIQAELNIKSIVYTQEEDQFIKLYAKPNSPVLGKRLQQRFGHFRQQIEALSHDQITALEEHGALTIDDETFTPDDILIFREAKSGTDVCTNRYISIVLDSQLTQTLIDEGIAREIVNRIQKTRKELNFNVSDRIHIRYQCNPELEKIIEQHKQYICGETLGLSLTAETFNDATHCQDTIDSHSLAINLRVDCEN